MSESRIVTNASYLNEHAATYREMRDWINGLDADTLEQPVMLGTPDGIYAMRRPVTIDGNGFMGEAIKVETEESE